MLRTETLITLRNPSADPKTSVQTLYRICYECKGCGFCDRHPDDAKAIIARIVRAEAKVPLEPDPPVVRLGQGDYTKDWPK